MDLMERRRWLMEMQTESVIDTSPVIMAENKRWNNGNLIDTGGISATIIYNVGLSSIERHIDYSGLLYQINIFANGVYKDYWSTSTGRERINANCDGIAVNIVASNIDTSHLFIIETGEIVFAGKNSIYYGHRNVSELN